jgi:hypothetical protein
MPTCDLNAKTLYPELKRRFAKIVKARGLTADKIEISARALSPKDAIGDTARKDYPILTGKEVMLQAEYLGAAGQAFTDSPALFTGTLGDILALDIESDAGARGLFIASLNAVMRKLGLAEGTVHCKNEEPELCAGKFVDYLREHYGRPKITLVGFQPALVENLSKAFPLRVLDLNPDHVGKVKYGVTIEHGKRDYQSAVLDWAELVLCTGSTLSNGTIVDYLNIGKEGVGAPPQASRGVSTPRLRQGISSLDPSPFYSATCLQRASR